MDRQRIYDAMLIKAFRKDVTLGSLYYWLKPYGITPPDETLKRQPPPTRMTVRVFVCTYLKPLGDRLWDTDKAQDIHTLDWMQPLVCQERGRSYINEGARIRKEADRNTSKTKLLGKALAGHMLSNQWNTVK